MNTKNNQAGFTLIEMMICVAIMGIMLSLIAPNMFNQLRKAETIRAESDLKTVATQSKFYYLDNYTLPTKIKQLVPNYFDAIPTDPWGHGYIIARGTRDYVVYSSGPDGLKGTRDDISHVINLRGYRNVRR